LQYCLEMTLTAFNVLYHVPESLGCTTVPNGSGIVFQASSEIVSHVCEHYSDGIKLPEKSCT
jgi:hypothetical protein